MKRFPVFPAMWDRLSCYEETRDWYNLLEWTLTEDGCCARCRTACAGVFDGPPGDWGAKRLPVVLNELAFS